MPHEGLEELVTTSVRHKNNTRADSDLAIVGCPSGTADA